MTTLVVQPEENEPGQPVGSGAGTMRYSDSVEGDSRRPIVLLVDDVADNLLALEGLLRRDDLDITTAPSGEAALEILLQQEVAVALIDVQMPGMDGFELASMMKSVERTRNIPIIFVTAGSRDHQRVFKGYEVGAVDYLFKPIDAQILRSKVEVFVTLEKHRQQLLEANRTREMFMAVLGHDLRNPINGILMTTRLLRREASDDTNRSLDRIHHSAERMQRMIEHLLDATRLRYGGAMTLSPEQVDLRDLVEETLNELEPNCQRCSVEFIGETVGAWDVDRLQQVLSNLMGNAIKHSLVGTPIAVQLDGRDNERVLVRVKNEGTPIAESLRPVLFQPFRRGGQSDGNRKGLGLGLFVVHELVRAHGGTVSVESSAASGTCFEISLPRWVTVVREPPARSCPGGGSGDRDTTGGAIPVDSADSRRVVLIVEDEPAARLALEELLRDEGYETLSASTSLKALELARTRGGRIDLLLTDVQLPDMPGDVLAEQLLLTCPGLRVVLMSGLPASNSTWPFVRKPIELETLLAALDGQSISGSSGSPL